VQANIKVYKAYGMKFYALYYFQAINTVLYFTQLYLGE